MLTLDEVMAELEAMGEENIRKIWLKHGIKEPFFGVKIANLKVIQKKLRVHYELAKELYNTGNADAMYLAGLVTDDAKMTKADLNSWVQKAESSSMHDYIVPWVASQGRYGFELGLEWIDSEVPHICCAGWATLGCCLALIDDSKLDIVKLRELLSRVEKNVHDSDDRVKLAMNTFIICLGSYVMPLHEETIASADNIGKVTADMNGTACKVPYAVDYIQKVKVKGILGKKRKMVKC